MPSATTSDFQHHRFMEKVFHGINWTEYTDIYVGLFITLPPLTGGVAGEVSTSGTGYARVAVPVGVGNWNVAGLEYSNAADITYAQPTAAWGTIVGAGLYDASTGGNLLYTAPLTTSKSVSDGDGAPKILTGQLRITRALCP